MVSPSRGMHTRSSRRVRSTERVGYLDVATFSTLFKRLAGQSPAQYRRGFNMRVVLSS